MRDPVSSRGGSGGQALIFEAVMRHRREAVLGIGAGLGWSGARLATPIFIRQGIDAGIRAHDLGALRTAVLSLAVVGMLGACLAGLRRYAAQTLATRIEADLRARLFGHLLRLDAGFHARWSAGRLVSRAASDIQQIQQPFMSLPITASNIVLLSGSTMVLGAIDPSLAAVALAPTVVVVVLAWRFTLKLGTSAQRLQQALGSLAGAIEDAVAGIRAIKGLGLETLERRRVEERTAQVYASAIGMGEVRARHLPLVEFFPTVGLVAVLWFGGYRVAHGSLTVGRLVQFYYYLVMLVAPLRMMGVIAAQWQRAAVSADLVAGLLSTEPAILDGDEVDEGPRSSTAMARDDASRLMRDATLADDAPGARHTPARGAIHFDSIDFAHDGQELLFRGLDLRIDSGETVALVGATGSGKSTLAALVARIYDVRGGRVLLDGVDVRRMPLDRLRNLIGMVFEDTFLFAGSVHDNIAFGRPQATRSDVERAARTAGAHDFVMAMDEGYDTPIGERGLRLSGGQRQRLALARAFLTDPRVLVLDSATTAVDATTEASIRQALAPALGTRTTILVSSRPSIVTLADRVVLLHGGRIADAGTHAALQSRSPTYRQILAADVVASVAPRSGWGAPTSP
ncbi:MAG: ABC transporter ATP-binding protein [Polyangiaceae bacterium]